MACSPVCNAVSIKKNNPRFLRAWYVLRQAWKEQLSVYASKWASLDTMINIRKYIMVWNAFCK